MATRDPIEWFNEKIANLTKNKNAVEQIRDEITKLEQEVEDLKARKPLEGSQIVFHLPSTLKSKGSDEELVDVKTIRFSSEEDMKLMDDVRILVIYSLQKRIGKLKEEYNSYNPNMWERIWNIADGPAVSDK
jgi:hypothetical protein